MLVLHIGGGRAKTQLVPFPSCCQTINYSHLINQWGSDCRCCGVRTDAVLRNIATAVRGATCREGRKKDGGGRVLLLLHKRAPQRTSLLVCRQQQQDSNKGKRLATLELCPFLQGRGLIILLQNSTINTSNCPPLLPLVPQAAALLITSPKSKHDLPI